MTKNKSEFTQRFKREIVREYNKGGTTMKALAEKHEGLSIAMIQAWRGKGKRQKKPDPLVTNPTTRVTPKADKPIFILAGETVAELRTQLDRLESLRG
jgi:transposase-like protein